MIILQNYSRRAWKKYWIWSGMTQELRLTVYTLTMKWSQMTKTCYASQKKNPLKDDRKNQQSKSRFEVEYNEKPK